MFQILSEVWNPAIRVKSGRLITLPIVYAIHLSHECQFQTYEWNRAPSQGVPPLLQCLNRALAGYAIAYPPRDILILLAFLLPATYNKASHFHISLRKEVIPNRRRRLPKKLVPSLNFFFSRFKRFFFSIGVNLSISLGEKVGGFLNSKSWSLLSESSAERLSAGEQSRSFALSAAICLLIRKELEEFSFPLSCVCDFECFFVDFLTARDGECVPEDEKVAARACVSSFNVSLTVWPWIEWSEI